MHIFKKMDGKLSLTKVLSEIGPYFTFLGVGERI